MTPMSEGDLREFLTWFKDFKEQQWATWNTRISVGVREDNGLDMGQDWQQGTRWLPMSGDEITATERRWSIVFPWDYRLFLSICGVPDRPALVERWVDDRHIETVEAHQFMNWRGTDTEIAQRLSWPVMGLFGDGKRPWWWQDGWGKWEGLAERWEEAERILTATRAAPQLIPFYGHRMLLPLPEEASAYLSVMGADIIVYADNLATGLLADCSPHWTDEFSWNLRSDTAKVREQPFWGHNIG